MKPPRYTDAARFKTPYVTAAKSDKEGYLASRWDRLYPGWRRAHLPAKVENVKPLRRKAA